MPFDKRDKANKTMVEEYFRKTDLAKEAFPVLARISELVAVEPKIPTTLIMRERPQSRETFIHKRGDFLDHGARVRPAGLAALHPLTPTVGSPTRLDLARW